MSIFATVFRSSHGIGPGTSVVLIRWIRRVAVLGTAARGRSCGHAFFVFRFLARGSAGTDVSFTRCTGRGLALSRRNKRRAKERRNNKSRECKFGSYKEGLPRLQYGPETFGRRLGSEAGNIVQIWFSKNSFVIAAQASSTFPNIRHLQNTGFAQSASNGATAYRGDTQCS
jgi:hypothetical protein